MLAIVGIAAMAIPMFSQAPRATKPSFEVASVKRNVSGDSYMDGSAGGRFIARAIPLRMLITEAYNVRDVQVMGGPTWMDTDRWDVEGKPQANDAQKPVSLDGPAAANRGRLMLQSLLEDRFQLKAHWETRELPVYELTVARGGPKIKTSSGVP